MNPESLSLADSRSPELDTEILRVVNALPKRIPGKVIFQDRLQRNEKIAKMGEMNFFGSSHPLKRYKKGHFNTSDGLGWVTSAFFHSPTPL